MPEEDDLLDLGNAAIVAPAGHGKTELIAKLAAKGQRTLTLTHTHAGVHAIRARLKRLGVAQSRVTVDTLAGWSMRYARAFPQVAQPSTGLPQNSAQWHQLYRGAARAMAVDAVRQVVAASYDRILIDEYQDCGRPQHDLVVTLSGIVPTLVFGDPLQGIFEFDGASLNWAAEIHPHFPLAVTLSTPYRWKNTNPDLGEWIAETREKLLNGHTIDLSDPRITYRQCEDAFDMSILFEGINEKNGPLAAIHCRRNVCNQLAKVTRGTYQAIEEIAAARLMQLAVSWDQAKDAKERLLAICELMNDCTPKRKNPESDDAVPQAAAILERIKTIKPNLGVGNGAAAARELMALVRQHPSVRVFRSELWRDAERAFDEIAAERVNTMTEAVVLVRQRLTAAGRQLPKRTVSTPLLLKGLEFDHVVIPDGPHFGRERYAQAKLFYVAISRASNSLLVAGPETDIQFDLPHL